nr:MAG TPA: hypothetical protein [Caudoviricetes sp.]
MRKIAHTTHNILKISIQFIFAKSPQLFSACCGVLSS